MFLLCVSLDRNKAFLYSLDVSLICSNSDFINKAEDYRDIFVRHLANSFVRCKWPKLIYNIGQKENSQWKNRTIFLLLLQILTKL